MTAADLTTSANAAVLPPMVADVLRAEIDAARPFLASTRRVAAPESGMGLHIPVIVARPETDVQAAEKDELASSTTELATVVADMVTAGGVGDMSLQLFLRSDPSYIALYLALLGEDLALESDVQATGALLADPDIRDGGPFDPLTLRFSDNVVTGERLEWPQFLWLSTAAVQALIDAKGPDGALVYPAGLGREVAGMRAVHVPALDGTAAAIAGPSSGFGWAEDGTYTLQAAVPAQASRDVAMVSFLWLAPLRAGLFIAYDEPGS